MALLAFLRCGGEGSAPEQGFPAASSEGQGMMGPSSQRWLQGCQAGCGAALGSRQGPCSPRGLCARTGTVLPARSSTQVFWGAPHGAVGRRSGCKERHPAGHDRAGSFCCSEAAAWIRAAHSSRSSQGWRVQAGAIWKQRCFPQASISCFGGVKGNGAAHI